ncbi:MlaD family protein [Haloflavibacter putidus]|uniref:MCE family protein n=1 Tax=Haloflavibacter putidus TaxID=2576776 RepID=A0A507ZVF2_9FLAO|nr:MlaD family protein [Haloflavibacter putidus]TQD40214.1 MCE family protein [Haloflavibacter putidus]
MKITKEVKTALLVIIAIILLIFGYSFLKGNNLLENNRTFYAVYEDVEGLAKSSKVTINGLQVGSVTDIRFLNNKGELLVTLNVQNKFEFDKSSTAQIYGGSLIGGKSVSIIPEYGGERAQDGDTLNATIDEGLLELVNDKLTPLQNKVENAVVSADSVITGVNKLLDPDTRKNLQVAIKEFSETMKSLKGASRSIDALLADNSSKLDRTFTNLDEMSANFNKFSDTLSTIEINKILNDFEEVASDFKKVAAKLENGEGTAGKLLNDDTAYENLERATKQMEELLQDIKLNPKRYVHFSVFGKNAGEYEKPKDSLK